MGAVAAVHAFALETPAYRVRQTSAAQFPEYLARLEAGARMAPEDWAAQLRAMLAHDVSRSFSGSLEQAAKAVRAKLLVVAATQDHMVNAQPAIEFAGHLKAEVIELGGDCGHLAFGCEAARVIPVVSRFLNAP
jgi:homoserine O-acetyltransferase